MRTLGNILWHFPFFGFITAFFTFILGGFLVITVIGAPIGMGLIQLSRFLLTPFSSSMVYKSQLSNGQNENKLWQSFGFIVRILYFPFGLGLAVMCIFQTALLFISIVGIPVAVVLAKSIGTFFNPVNRKCVPRAVAKELETRQAKADVDKYLNKTADSTQPIVEPQLDTNNSSDTENQ